MKMGGWHAAPGAVVLAALLLSGCVTPEKPLYYWGDYQPVVYSHFRGDAPEAQRVKLEQTAHLAQSRGEAVPPGSMPTSACCT